MPTILKNRLITTDQTVGLRTVQPSTVGSAQRGAEANRTANAGSSRRAGPGESKATGTFKVTGKLKGAVGDWLKSAKASSRSLDANLTALKAANDAGDDETAAMLGEVIQALVDRFKEKLFPQVQDLAAQVQAEAETVQGEQSADEAGDIDTAGRVVAHETGTGESPRSAAQLRAEVGMDGMTVERGVAFDAATILQREQGDWKKQAIKLALDAGDEATAYRIQYGIAPAVDNDPVGTMTRKYGSAE